MHIEHERINGLESWALVLISHAGPRQTILTAGFNDSCAMFQLAVTLWSTQKLKRSLNNKENDPVNPLITYSPLTSFEP